MPAIVAPASVAPLLETLRRTARESGARQLIGIVGAPGTGKSTFAQYLADQLGNDECVVVPMDGFHLANTIIEGTPLQSRKGAIDTFDAGGYLSLLRRLKERDEPVVYAPSYRRGLEEAIGASIAIPKSVAFVITEGNYLLSDIDPWNRVREFLSETWFVDTPREVRIGRLIERHVAFGKDLEAATAWAEGPDEANARYIETTKIHANRIIEWS
ncbi:nucleoside/nucleotide kinase family protein [Cryobacterium glaciale]|uniref:Nucleoside/nucleotide kinase family protein n=1 Tax=Cryobacterium glaciale TaxID=1259145 RepID=A0A4R8V112_9MICO|nr:nucleoside/nucleotide kinase family protein [Cryobacterium glaciale]TFB75869.1 nucleoside/nucleotide kinase family protein [Cryobacterium glaciale]